MTRATRAVIDLSALRHNLAQTRRAAPQSKIIAVVKANGYGHGLMRVARALSGVDAFGVACLDEALALRAAEITTPIVLLEGFTLPEDIEQLARHDLQAVVHHDTQVQMLEAAASKPLAVWLKVDTGMHRLGFAPAVVPAMHARLTRCAGVAPDIRFMTHLANADDRGSALTVQQVALFEDTIRGFDGERSIGNSAGLLGWPECRSDWVRPGIMLYGVSPFAEASGAQHGLRPVMTLHSELIAVNHFRRGDPIGYGGIWRCPEDMPVGVVAIGYGDGYPRHAESGTPVLVNGRRVPLVGRVSMDMVCVDLRRQPRARVGDPVILWGDGLPVEEVAQHAGTIGYQLLCAVTQRVRFVEHDDADSAAKHDRSIRAGR